MNELPVRVRRGVPSDLQAIVAVERAAGTAPHWPEFAYAAILEEQAEGKERTARCLWVAEAIHGSKVREAGSIEGFAVGAVVPGAHEGEMVAELESVAVIDSARRRGLGRALCGAVLEWCRERGAGLISLEVRASGEGAIALYRGLGFAAVGVRPNYYRSPDEDALLFELPLR